MKKVVRELIKCLVQSDILWRYFGRWAASAGSSLAHWRHVFCVQKSGKMLCPDLTVCRGPFTGLRFPPAASNSLALYPKLLGGYECEIHPWWERIRKKQYELIVNVGCAEGFYAVGSARLFPSAQVVAYDIDSTAQELCRNMARLNGVGDRISIKGFCSKEELQTILRKRQALVICDCEGYERELFDEDSVRAATQTDLMIEVHDFENAGLLEYLLSRFNGSHQAFTIWSLPPAEKVKFLDLPQCAGMDEKLKEGLLSEQRHNRMPWVFFAHRDPSQVDKASHQ